MISKASLENLLHKLNPTKLLAVTKSVGIEEIKTLYDYGQRDFGENRVEALLEKESLSQELNLNWHFIGKLQRKKVKKLFSVKKLKYIHSVDSFELLNEMIKYENLLAEKVNFFIQFNLSEEDEKSGFLKKQVDEVLSFIQNFSSDKLNFCGLMTMATFRTDDKDKSAFNCFNKLNEMNQQFKAIHSNSLLSMGMSGDYEIAKDCGANWVRIGSLLF